MMMMSIEKVQLLFDRWTTSGVHHVALFASFVVEFQTMHQGVKASRGRHEFRLLSAAPLLAMNESEEEEISEDDTSLDAGHHANFLKLHLTFSK